MQKSKAKHTHKNANLRKRIQRKVGSYIGSHADNVSSIIGQGQGARRDTVVSIPRTMQLFPDKYRAWATLETNGSIATVASYNQTFKINAPAILFGPRVGFAGAFGANAPAGMKYLLSGLSDTAAGAPYSQYQVRRYEMRVTIASASIAGNSIPFIGGITFSSNLTATNAMPITQLPEQPRTISQTIPHLTTNRPIVLANSVVVSELVGLSDREYSSQHYQYAGTTTSDPVVPLYVQLWFRSFDGATTGTYQFLVRHRFEIEFFGLNSYSTNIPSFLEKPEQKETTSSWSLLSRL